MHTQMVVMVILGGVSLTPTRNYGYVRGATESRTDQQHSAASARSLARARTTSACRLCHVAFERTAQLVRAPRWRLYLHFLYGNQKLYARTRARGRAEHGLGLVRADDDDNDDGVDAMAQLTLTLIFGFHYYIMNFGGPDSIKRVRGVLA